MYKAVGEERFLMWAVCSIQLQVNYSSGGQKLLPLAEALIKKHISKSSLHEPEALTMYISILEQQKKFDAAFEVISGDLGSLILREEDKLRMKGLLLGQACNYAAASEIFQKVLEMRPDDWETFLQYLCLLLEEDIDWSKHATAGFCTECISLSKSKLSEEEFDIRLSSALSFVEELQKDAVKNCTRGPYLAAVEIERRRSLMSGNCNKSKVVEALVNYFERFGHYPCFATDVEKYLHELNEEENAELLDKISKKFAVYSEVHTLGRTVTVFRIQEICSSMWKKSIQDLETTTLKKLELFCKNLHLSKNLEQQESMVGEELLFMATNTLALLFWRTKNLGYLLEAILVLEFGLHIRRHVNLLKVLLVHLYSFLEILPLACDWYLTLDVKNILLETISHHILPQMLTSPHFNETSDLLNEYLKFADDHARDSGDLTCLAYRHRNYSRAIEFVAFHIKLKNSSQYLISKLDSFIFNLKISANNPDELEKVLKGANYGLKPLDLAQPDKIEKLTCNIDSQTRPWWSPRTSVNYLSMPFDEESASVCFGPKPCIHKNENVGPDKNEFERKSLVPRIVYLSMQAASPTPKENKETTNGGASSATIADELGSLLERYARSIGFSFNDAIDAILSITTGENSFKEFSDIVSCISFAIFVNAWNSSLNHTEKAGKNTISWEVVDKLITTCIREKLGSMGPALTSTGSEVLVLVQLVNESLSWHILIIQSFIKSVIPLGKKKKKSGSADKQNINIPLLKAMQASINCVSSAIREVHKWVLDQLNSTEDHDLDILMSYLTTDDNSVGPGKTLNVLKESLGVVEESEVGDRIYDTVKSWNPTSVLRKIVQAQCRLLTDFSRICDSKLRVLESLKQSF
ncbi:tetratricopeptide repeat (TPR)-like superfamily protein isoform X2 [Carex rostrata]